MTAEARRAELSPARRSLPRVLGPIRPRPRWQELRLLLLVALALAAGSVSLGATLTGRIGLYDPWGLGIYLAALLIAHGAHVLAGRRTDQVLLPAVAMLGGLSLLLMERLPQDLVIQRFFGTSFGLAEVQLIWLVSAIAVATTLGIVVRSDSWLRRYKYTWAAVGVGLLLLTFVLGTEINGQRLTLQIGPISGQPSELLKVILVVFLAGYLSENRASWSSRTRASGRCGCRPCRISRRWSRCGRSRSGSWSSSATWAPRCSSSGSSWPCCTRPPGGSAWSSSGSSCSCSGAP